ncbi:MAG: Calcineurin-like phosphoesterase superfamily domain protein [Gemmataceae bacterium]|nr:Calcineurin-like phosphoesterase superfamily domain protein [Gemmataceae bacterium]
MKKLLLGGGVLALLAVTVSLSQSRTAADPTVADPNGLRVESEGKNPWTTLKLNAAADQFQFAVVSDRTGGHREKVFSRAVSQVNLLQPQFVMSVGDLIEGYTTKEEVITEEWDQFDGYVRKLEMPFFYVAGNHDLTNKMQVQKWGERYGRKYYHFTYKNCLFLSLCSENPPDFVSGIDPEQRDYVRKTLAATAGVRWTFVFLHKPIWTAKDLDKNGWGDVEQALAGRKYTVFCGHVHRYQKFVRNGNNYYQLATTGGGSRLRGTEYGEFDHVAWVTMKPGAPLIANVLLDGILPEDLTLPETEEPGTKRKLLPTYPVTGRITLEDKPVPGATVSLYRLNAETKKFVDVCDGLTDEAGGFKLSTYGRFDGCPAGEFVVTVVKTGKGYYDGETKEKSTIPEKYATPGKSELKVLVREGANEMYLNLTAK